MNDNLKRKLATGIATGAVLLNALTPMAFADTTIEISGNGTNSDNTTVVTQTQSSNVTQTNNANVTNNVRADADTGDNDAKDNTGGDVSIDTGDADVTANVSNTLNSNSASVDCCVRGDTNVLISGNGSDTDNDATLTQTQGSNVNQRNNASVYNNVNADSETGENNAKDNTGGNVSITTGNANASVSISNTANANWASVGGGEGGGNLSIVISGNGTDSDNTVVLTHTSGSGLTQDNSAHISNRVEVDAETGENDAKDNTGGDSSIDTGDADVDVEVDNMVNFNWAAVDCGCLFENVLAKISGNGEDSNNDITATLTFNSQEGTLQENDLCLDNQLTDIEAETGENKVKDNTAQPDGDPSIETGDADIDVDVDNSANFNVLNGEGDMDWPDVDFDVHFSLNLSELMALLASLS